MKKPSRSEAVLSARTLTAAVGGINPPPVPWLFVVANPQPSPWSIIKDNPEPSPWSAKHDPEPSPW